MSSGKIQAPTLKQLKAHKEMVENGRTASAAMRAAGYSAAMASHPERLTRSQGFMMLMDKIGLTDEKLSRKLDEGLEATKAVVMGGKSEESFVDIQPDYAVRHKYLETGLRLKGLGKQDPTINFNFGAKSDEQREVYDL